LIPTARSVIFVAVGEGCGGNPQIIRADEFAALFQEAENFALMPSVGIEGWPQSELGFYGDEI
jgi:hypothetical protein